MTGIGDEDHLHLLVVGLLHPLEHFIVENALFGAGSFRGEASEQEGLVHAVRLVVTAGRFGFLPAMAGITEDDGVAGLCLGDELIPRGNDVLLGGIVVEQRDDFLGAETVQRFRHVARVIHRAVEIVHRADIVVDADHHAVEFGGVRLRRRHEGERQRSQERHLELPALPTLAHT